MHRQRLTILASSFGAILPLLVLLVSATGALAAEPGRDRPSLAVFIAEVLVLILVGRLLGEVMQRLGQPTVMGQLIAGILLGPSVLGAVFPDAQHALFPGGAQKAMLDGIAQFGVLLLLLMTGLETDVGLIRKVGRAAVSASVSGIVVPFACGFTLGEFLPDSLLPDPAHRLVTSLLLGVALSISSVKIVAMVVREMNFLRRNIGQIIVASAIIDDTIGWIIIAVTFGLAQGGTVELGSLATSVGGTAAFLIVSATLGRRLVFLLIRWVNDTFASEVAVVSAVLVVMCAMALVTHVIGVSEVLGAFVAGILVGQSPILTKHVEEQVRGLTIGLFAPVFFGLSGLGADLRILAEPSLLLLFGALVAIATVGKFSGAFLGGWIGGLNRAESLALASGMNARGSTEVIVATIGLSMGLLSQNLFTMIVAMAVVTTLAMPPMLRWALRRLPIGQEEHKRLEREASDAKGFLPNLERMLVAVDESPNGRFASRLAGLLAGSKGMPVTVLGLGGAEAGGSERVKAAAAESAPTLAKQDDARADLDVTTLSQDAPTEEAVASANRGHGLLVVGLAREAHPDGGFGESVERAARGFAGPLAIINASGPHERDPAGSGLDILVPVTGTDVSRRGVEVALALARAVGVPITALHVSSGVGSGGRRPGARPRRDNAALVRELGRMAEQYGVTVRTTIRVNLAPDEAILRQARLGGHNLIVLGVSRRPGDALSFGYVADTVLETAETSLLLVSTGA